VQGFVVLVALVANAVWSLRRTMKAAAGLPDDQRRDATLAAYGLFITVVTYLGCCFTITLIYVEGPVVAAGTAGMPGAGPWQTSRPTRCWFPASGRPRPAKAKVGSPFVLKGREADKTEVREHRAPSAVRGSDGAAGILPSGMRTL